MIKKIIEQWHEKNFTMIDEVAQAALIAKLEREFIARAEVAAELTQLRKELADTIESPAPDEKSRQYDAATRAAVCGIDATITKLGLAPV